MCMANYDPSQYLGHLKLELMRAVRLVTDTGLHAKGWTREQSIAYMMDIEGRSEADSRNATVTTADGRTFRTADGGMSWVQQ